MYTTTGEAVVFLHNGDFSGDVKIVVEPDQIEKHEMDRNARITVPFEDIKLLVASYVRMKNIEALENASDDDVLFTEWSVNE